MKKPMPVVIVVFVLTGCVITFFFWPSERGEISLAAYDKITVGMTSQPVEDILGGPPRCESRGALKLMYGTSHRGDPLQSQWWASGIQISVCFSNGVVVRKEYLATRPDGPEGMVAKIRAWLP
jgi:hypothetical protein